MTTLFGFSMDSIMHVVLAAFVLVSVGIAVLAIRNRLLLKLGLRNIPRRRAQSLLVIFGLMLSTVVVTSAFAAGDTFSYSIRASAATSLGGVDEILTNDPGLAIKGQPAAGPASPPTAETVRQVQTVLARGHLSDGVMGVDILAVPIQDLSSRQTDAQVDLTGVPASYPAAFQPLTTTSGSKVSLTGLSPRQVYINSIAAQDLNAHAGDRLHLYIHNRPVNLTVRDVLRTEGMAGGGIRTGGDNQDPVILLPLDRVQTLSGRVGTFTDVLISNRGSTLGGAGLTRQVTDRLSFENLGYQMRTAKQDQLDNANQAGTAFTSGFIAFGLFSITAGVMLIFLIFVMLAAERRTEMGVARAIGTQRRHLVQQFLFEGYIYDLGAAIVGVVIGLVVGLGIVSALASLSSNSGFFQLQRHIEPRSVVVAFCVGALVTFVTVVSSCWRASRLNIVSAIRDLPDEVGIDRSIRAAFARPWNDLMNAGHQLRRKRVLPVIRSLIAAPWHFLTAFRVFISRGPILLVAGYLLTIWGIQIKQQFPFSAGVSFLVIGLAMVLRWLLVPFHIREPTRNRIGFSMAGLGLVVFWLLPFDFFRSDLQLGVEMFVLAGLMLTLGGVWTVMFNIDLLLNVIMAVTGGLGRLTPVIKTAVMYPLQQRFRTGMALFMFSLVMFALTVQAVLLGSFNAQPLDLNRDAGGFAIYGTVAGKPIANLTGRIAADPQLRGRIAAAGSSAPEPIQLGRLGGTRAFGTFERASVVDDGFLSGTRYTLHSRARGYASDLQVWEAVRTHPGDIVVDASFLPRSAGGAPAGFVIPGITYGQTTFNPAAIELRAGPTGKAIPVTVIGILDRSNASGDVFSGLYVGRRTLTASGIPAPRADTYFFRLTSGQNTHAVALALGSAFLQNGLDLKETQVEYAKNQSLSLGFNNLLLGFMALGLVVGIAALGVIATRSVVERRQQIGVLRAIGFPRRMIQTTFLLEASFVAILGTSVGMVLGVLLGRQVVLYFAKQQPTLHLVVPWPEIILLVLGAYLASLLTTYLPAWQASRVYPAEALRYE